MNTKILVLFSLLLAIGNQALATQDSGFYIGAGVGESDVSDAEEVGITDHTDTAYKVYGGYEFNRWIAAEAGYVDFGSFHGQIPSIEGPINARLEADGWIVGLRPQIQLGQDWLIQGQVGGLFWDAKARLTGGFIDESLKDDGEEIYYGIGFGRNLGASWRLSAEWTRFDFDDGETDLLNLALNYRFGK